MPSISACPKSVVVLQLFIGSRVCQDGGAEHEQPVGQPTPLSPQNEPAWSRSEKAIAHKAFDAALERELQEVIREAKQKADQIKEPADLWDLEHYLTQRRKEIDRKYDYRYSQLDLVFGRLLREKWIDEEDLRGLGEDKLRAIRSCAKFFAGMDPA